jgi:hypothetical protein
MTRSTEVDLVASFTRLNGIDSRAGTNEVITSATPNHVPSTKRHDHVRVRRSGNVIRRLCAYLGGRNAEAQWLGGIV